MNSNFQVIGLTRLGIKPKCTAREAYAVITRPSERLSDVMCSRPHVPDYAFIPRVGESVKRGVAQQKILEGPE